MPKAAAKFDPDVGHHFGKSDLERIGLFTEMDYMNGKGYVSPFATELHSGRTEGRQLFPGYPKSKCGTQDGYFQDTFERVFEKEAYLDRGKMILKAQKQSAEKNISKIPFVAPGSTKEHACPGDYYGTFGGKLEAFSPELKKKPPYKKEAPNMFTNPAKKGGPGYPNITFSKYPEHSNEFYDAGREQVLKNYAAHQKGIKNGPLYSAHCPQAYFDPNPYREENPGPTYIPPKEEKLKDAGVKWYPPTPSKLPDGCFDKWPEHSQDKYLSQAEIMRGKYKKTSKVFYPQAWGRTMQTCSIVNNKLDSAMNTDNWKTFQPITFPNS